MAHILNRLGFRGKIDFSDRDIPRYLTFAIGDPSLTETALRLPTAWNQYWVVDLLDNTTVVRDITPPKTLGSFTKSNYNMNPVFFKKDNHPTRGNMRLTDITYGRPETFDSFQLLYYQNTTAEFANWAGITAFTSDGSNNDNDIDNMGQLATMTCLGSINYEKIQFDNIIENSGTFYQYINNSNDFPCFLPPSCGFNVSADNWIPPIGYAVGNAFTMEVNEPFYCYESNSLLKYEITKIKDCHIFDAIHVATKLCANPITQSEEAPYTVCENGNGISATGRAIEFVCQVPEKIDTEAPTNTPTVTPTSPPSIGPTFTPTSPPSIDPTAIPTNDPTKFGETSAPSNTPSAKPSLAPSNSPTVKPSETPTIRPFNSVTNSPTSANEPTNSPTNITSNIKDNSDINDNSEFNIPDNEELASWFTIGSIIVVGIFLILSIIGYFVAWGRRNDVYSFPAVLMAGIYTYDMISDVFFAIDVYYSFEANTDNQFGNICLYIFIASVVTILIPVIATTVWLLYYLLSSTSL